MTKLEQATSLAIRKWCEAQGLTVKKLGIIYPRAYVVARPAPLCLIIARPPMDNTVPYWRELNRGHVSDGSATCHTFDEDLKVGDWCSIAYVLTEEWGGHVAIPAVICNER